MTRSLYWSHSLALLAVVLNMMARKQFLWFFFYKTSLLSTTRSEYKIWYNVQ